MKCHGLHRQSPLLRGGVRWRPSGARTSTWRLPSAAVATPSRAMARDHAAAALEILEETLSVYPEADRSARFDLVRTSLAPAVRFFQAAEDGAGRAVGHRYPALRTSFRRSKLTDLQYEEYKGWRHEWWLPIDGEPYALY